MDTGTPALSYEWLDNGISVLSAAGWVMLGQHCHASGWPMVDQCCHAAGWIMVHQRCRAGGYQKSDQWVNDPCAPVLSEFYLDATMFYRLLPIH